MCDISATDLKTEIRKILQGADLDNVSAKKVRSELQLKLDFDFKERKKEVDKIFLEVMNELAEGEEEDSEDEVETKTVKNERVQQHQEYNRGDEAETKMITNNREKIRSLITTNSILDSVSEKGTEVCVLKIPKTFDLKDLRNCDLSDSFNVNGTQFNLTQHKDEKPVLTATSDKHSQFSIIKLKAKKIYTISECFAEPIVPKIEIPPRYIVPQITDIIQRHPIYGAEYVRDLKRKNPDPLNLDADLSKVKTEVKVEQNINEDVLQQPKKKKKKKDKKSEA